MDDEIIVNLVNSGLPGFDFAVVSPNLSLPSNLLSVCFAGDRTLWSLAGQLAGATSGVALPPISSWRLRSSATSFSRKKVADSTRDRPAKFSPTPTHLLSVIKTYQCIPIIDCGEPLLPIPLEQFAVESPHPYEKLGAPYGERSPYHLRKSVLNSLIQAQAQLQSHHPDWRIQIFDAYRPIAVQQFMVDFTFSEVVQAQGLDSSELSESQRGAIWEQVYQFWAVPSLNPHTPPPHSTGAAVDVTLVDDTGMTVNMGSAIDELSARSHPDYFANRTDSVGQQYHTHRLLLWDGMRHAGFQRHPGEWWHFCLGDQMWAWLSNQSNPTNSFVARYGRVD